MTAKNQDFVVKNGLQVTSNLVVGAYTGTASSQQISNGAIISGAVGIGTANVIVGTQLQVANGNIRIASANKGLIFPDGTRQTTAATNTPSYGYQYTLQFAGAGNAFSGDSANLLWSSGNATLQTNNITVTSSAAATGQGTGALQVVGGGSVGGNLFIGGNFTVGGQVNFANVGGIQNLVVNSLTSNTYVQAATTIKGNNIVANVNVGIGTATTNYPLDIYGNVHIGNTATASGIVFPDGTFQATAATTTPSFGAPGTVQIAGAGNTYSGNTAGFFWDTGLSQLDINRLQVNNGATVNSLNSNTNVVATNIQSTSTATVNTIVSNVYGVFGQNVSINSTNASTGTGTGALTVAGGANVRGNVYVGNRVGFTSSNVSVVYQFYNSATNSLDTVFG